MGKEYLIACNLPDRIDPQQLLDTLANPSNTDGWTAFTASVETEGFYFCDNCWSDAATVALRKLIDSALLHCDEVSVREP